MREGWINKKLGDVCQVSAGQGAPQGEDNYSDVGIPFVKAGNLVELINGKQESDIQKVSDEVAKAHRLVLYKTGSVVFAKSGMSCMKGHVYTLKNDCYVVSHLAILQPQNISSAYLNYYLQHHKPNTLIKDEGYPSISLKDIENSTISLPSNIEQENRVVSELDKINELIRLKKEQLSDYDKLAQSLFYEMFGDPIENEKGWEVKKFANLYKLKSGDGLSAKNFKIGTIPVYGGNGISGYHNTYNMDGDYIIIGRVGVYCGNVREVHGKFWLTDNAFQLFYDQKIQCPCFIHYLLNILDLHKFANAAAQPVISNLTLKDVGIIIPPLHLQQLFAQRIELIEKQKSEIQSTIADLESLLASRMQYWFE